MTNIKEENSPSSKALDTISMVNKLIEKNFYDGLHVDEGHIMSDEFLINSLDHTVLIEREDGKLRYKLKISVGAFIPSDFKLKLKDRSLLVRASRECLKPATAASVDVVSNVKEFEEFKREINLPTFVLSDTLICYLEVYEDNQNFLFIEGKIDEILHQKSSGKMPPQSNAPSTIHRPKLADCVPNRKVFKSIDQLGDKRIENYSSNGCLKYKFELHDFDSNNISISVRNKNVLVVYAYDNYLGLDGKPVLREFSQDISLPDNIELCNIRNSFDETLGTLRIDVPLKFNADSDTPTETNDNDKYLELVFDLKTFKYEGIEFYKNKEDKNVLVVRARKEASVDTSPFIRKYVLPDWVGTNNVRIFEENQKRAGLNKNLLILNLPFV